MTTMTTKTTTTIWEGAETTAESATSAAAPAGGHRRMHRRRRRKRLLEHRLLLQLLSLLLLIASSTLLQSSSATSSPPSSSSSSASTSSSSSSSESSPLSSSSSHNGEDSVRWRRRGRRRRSSNSEEAHLHMSQSELRRIFQVEHHNDVPEYELVKIHSETGVRRRRRRSTSSYPYPSSDLRDSGEEIHRVNLRTSRNASLQLNLARIRHLLPQQRQQQQQQRQEHQQHQQQQTQQHQQWRRTARPVSAQSWYADAYPENVTYSRTEQDSEYVGDTFQDEENRAALLLYKDREDDALLMDGTIGDDIVVKPLSAQVRQVLSTRRMSAEDNTENGGEDDSGILEGYVRSLRDMDEHRPRRTELHDDYAFLDEDEELEDEDVFVERPQNSIGGGGGGLGGKKGKNLNLNNYGNYGGGQMRDRWARRKRVKREGEDDGDKGPESDDVDFEYNEIDDEEDDGGYEFTPDTAEKSGERLSDLHVIYRRKNANMEHSSDYHFMEVDQLPTRPPRTLDPQEKESEDADLEEEDDEARSSRRRKKRQAPYIIFPEILCIVDYDGYRLHGKDNIAIKRYVISFWNGIDLRYKLLKGPSVKISIAGIIISRGRDATPYLERNRVGRDAIDSAAALTDMGKYLFLERRLPVYDIAVAITKLDMCRRKSRIGQCNRGTAGFAYVGGACVVNKRLEKVNSVAIVEDTGGFSGIIVAAHELGHLLGAVHDGSPPPSYLGGPGARKCRWEDGFIMSDLRHTSKGFRWSHCTVKQFHHFLNGETATCMYNSPHEESSLPRVLPGKLLSLDAQCRKDRGTSACFKDDRVCAQLFCFDAGSGYCVSYRPAAEGSRCGDGYMCLNGKCVPEHENAVDFSGDGFFRRSGSSSGVDDDIIENYTEPKDRPRRKWWNSLTSTTDKSSVTATTIIITTTSTTANPDPSRKPWWKRIHRPAPKPWLSTSTTTTTTTTPKSTTTTYSTTTTTTTTTTTSSTTSSSRKKVPKRKKLKTTATTTTTTTTTSTTSPITRTSKTSSSSSKSSSSSSSRSSSPSNNRSVVADKSSSSDGESGKCEDRINNIAGSLTCKAFLRSFAYQYCRHKYIKKNCCAAHKIYCNGLRLSRVSISSSSVRRKREPTKSRPK